MDIREINIILGVFIILIFMGYNNYRSIIARSLRLVNEMKKLAIHDKCKNI